MEKSKGQVFLFSLFLIILVLMIIMGYYAESKLPRNHIIFTHCTRNDNSSNNYNTIKYNPALHVVDPMRHINRNIDPMYRVMDFVGRDNN